MKCLPMDPLIAWEQWTSKRIFIVNYIYVFTKTLFQFSDCWYFYALNPLDRYLSGRVDVEPDQTIEILMTELNPKIMEIFSKKNVIDGSEATKVIFQDWVDRSGKKVNLMGLFQFQKSGIDVILPCMMIDDYLFDPCGYSMNGILKNESVDYGLVICWNISRSINLN